MKKKVCIGIIAMAVIADYLYWRTNQNVYSLNAYAGGLIAGPQWHIGTAPNWIGFSQYTDVGMPSEWGKKRDNPTFTDIDLAFHRYRIGSSASKLGLIAACGAAFILWVGLAVRKSSN
jgi:hypothetical protein